MSVVSIIGFSRVEVSWALVTMSLSAMFFGVH